MGDENSKIAMQPQVTRPKTVFTLDPVPSPVIEAYKKDIDRTLLLENLKLTAEQRFQKFEAFMQGVMDLRQAGARYRQNRKSNPYKENQANEGSA